MGLEDRRVRLDRLFEQALELNPEARPAFLDTACAGEPELRSELEQLLRLAAESTGTLDPEALSSGPLWRDFESRFEPEPPHAPDTGVGPWRLREMLGQGGMGVVYRAVRADGEFEQEAALKLLHPGIVSEDALRRFEQERQILAGLDHPAIAGLLDGGRTAEGRPYFAMELVLGLPLDRYCDERRLSVAERLRLFVRVSRAVEHAHHHLIVHRDLKPSNIVVTETGQVKLLDFGIAKLLGGPGGAEPLTRTITRVLTPDYASPEQVLGRPVTIASDVYQLGLLLYELLTGRRAYRVDSGASLLEMEEIICRAVPRRPSTAVGSPEPGAPPDDPAAHPEEVADRRRTTPGALSRRLRGDLDTIVMRGLHKEPERRYVSVTELAEDVERHLTGLPVRARGDGLAYRAGRFVARHRVAVAAAFAVVLSLAGWAASATVQARSIARERDRARAEAAKAERVKTFVLRLFESIDPEEARGRELSAREVLERGWASIENELSGQPEVQVELLNTVGEIYRKLGLYGRAEVLLQRSLAVARRLDRPLWLATALANNGRLLRDQGEYEAAEALLGEALDLRRGRLGDEHTDVLETLSDLGLTTLARGHNQRAENLFRQVLTVRERLFGEGHPDLADSLAELGVALRAQGDYARAEPLLSKALQMRRRLLPAGHPQLATSLSNLGLVKRNLGALEAAETLYREALTAMIAAYGEDHPHVAVTLNNLGQLLRARGELVEAEALLRRALAVRRRTLGRRHPQVAMNFNALGRLLYDAGDIESAERHFHEALAIYAPDHPWRAASVSNLGRVREHRGDYRGAARLYREALADQRARYGDNYERAGIDIVRLGGVLRLQGHLDDAERLLREALAIFRKRLPQDHARVAEALVPLATLLIERSRSAQAEPLLREAIQIRRARLGPGHPLTAEAEQALKRLHSW